MGDIHHSTYIMVSELPPDLKKGRVMRRMFLSIKFDHSFKEMDQKMNKQTLFGFNL